MSVLVKKLPSMYWFELASSPGELSVSSTISRAFPCPLQNSAVVTELRLPLSASTFVSRQYVVVVVWLVAEDCSPLMVSLLALGVTVKSFRKK